MSTLTIPQLVRSLQDVLLKVDGQTSADTQITDHLNEKHTYVDWIQIAQEATKAAKKSTAELPKLDQLALALQYRTQLHKVEAAVEIDPLKERFKKLSEKLFPQGIPEDFATKQIRHLSDNYATFARNLLEPTHEELAVGFFRFCLLAPSQSSHLKKDLTYWVDIFIKYPQVAERLMMSSLYEKLGQFPQSIDLIPGRGVCIKMELWKGGAWAPIQLTEENLKTELCFKNKVLGGEAPGITLTLEEVFQQFEGSTPAIDLSKDGIINLNSHLLESKDTDSKVTRVEDVGTWTEYTPYVELTLPELMKLYPEAKDEPFAFVLRANSRGPKSSQAHFDFIEMIQNGNYRVFSIQCQQNPNGVLFQQKKAFYPLTAKQGSIVIRKVAQDISKCRQAQADGKPIPPIDIQSYIDEVLGDAFYSYLSQLSSDRSAYNLHQTREQIADQLTQARKNLDTAAFEEFLQPLVDKLVGARHMEFIQQFINNSLTTIYSLLQKDSTKMTLPSIKKVTEAATELDKAGRSDQMKPSLVALASLCFEVLHPYRMKVADAEKETPIVGRIFQAIEAIPWIWLKKLLTNFFLTILGPFRGYHYKTLETSHLDRLPRLIQAIRNLKPEEFINRPSQFFSSSSEETKKLIEGRVTSLLAKLRIPATV